MTLLEPDVTTPDIDPDIQADIDKFREVLAGYQSGDVSEDVFRVFRLTNGIYGQRQGGTNQMVRVKVPYGSMTPEQFDMIANLVERYSRGWGHITTRQNLQFHYVQLDQIPDVMQHLANVGLTTREACGDTVRNIQGCHLAGACPHENLDITPWAEAAYQHFVRNPLGQRLPRKFKINFSGCETDCGQAMFNDAGVIATTRTLDDGTVEAGFRVFIAGGLGTTPFPAMALEDFTPKEELLPTLEAILRIFEQTGNRDNKLRARLKWVVENLGFEEVQRRILNTRKFLLASSSYPGGLPTEVRVAGDAPAGIGNGAVVTQMGQGTPVSIGGASPYDRWFEANVVRGIASGQVSAYAWAQLGDITADQFRGIAAIQREFEADIRLTNRQNLIIRGLDGSDLPRLYELLSDIGMAEEGAELVRDVVACPGADTCNLAVTQSRGLAKAIGDALDAEGLGTIGGLRINISGCTNSCGQHHASDIGFFGAERRANGRSAPGYQMLLGGYVGQERMHFGEKATRLPAKAAAQAAVRVVRQFNDERTAGESFRGWLERAGGAAEVGKGLKDLDEFPAYDDNPDFYVDFDETGPYSAEIGESECAT
ncbi:MAG: nitrite/sulfite reductase [Acidimicrobiales bacterium]|nr:nitrite/sulfite reductase [Acidimicrobiales bacterium]